MSQVLYGQHFQLQFHRFILKNRDFAWLGARSYRHKQKVSMTGRRPPHTHTHTHTLHPHSHSHTRLLWRLPIVAWAGFFLSRSLSLYCALGVNCDPENTVSTRSGCVLSGYEPTSFYRDLVWDWFEVKEYKELIAAVEKGNFFHRNET